MTLDETLINQIIRDVLAQMRSDNQPPRATTMVAEHNLLLIDDAVITEETLENRVQGKRKIAIGSKSVLTPTGREYLKSHDITWSRGTNSPSESAKQAAWNIIVVDATPNVKSALSQFSERNNQHQQELANSPADAASRAISAICRSNNTGVIVLTTRAEVVSCLANRNDQVRAAVVQDALHWVEVKEHLQCNVCCINPSQRSVYEIQNLLNQITQ